MKTILIDGHSVAYRAFYALPDSLETQEGFPTNVIHGFVMMLRKVVSDLEPENLIVTWDVSRKTFRSDLYKEYKSNRTKSPDIFKVQIPVLRELLDKFNIAQLSMEGYEADDILGSLAKSIASKKNRVYILTGDRDAFQLIDSNINILYTKKGISETELVNKKVFNSMYGLDVDQYIDYLALKGDTSDNIPGVPGIGKKTAISLLKDFKSIEGILNNIDSLKPKQIENINNNIDQLNISRVLATIVTNLKLEIPNSLLESSIFFDPTLVESNLKLLQKYELKSFLKGLGLEENIPHVPEEYPTLKTINKDSWIGIDRETVLVADDNRIYVFEGTDKELLDQISINQGSFNLVMTYPYYHRFSNNNNLPKPNLSLDLAAYILNSNSKPDSYEKIAKYFKLDSQSKISEDEYDINLIHILKNIKKIQSAVLKQLEDKTLSNLYNNIDAKVLPILVEMSLNGINVDLLKIKELSKIVNKEIIDIESKIYKEAGTEFNINSPKQISNVLYDVMKIEVIKKTPKGSPSTDASVLETLSKDYKIASYLLDYRELEKLRSTYIDGLNSDVLNNKIHSVFNIFGTTTGRLSSEKPNLQNIPIKSEYGKKIREFFIPSKGRRFVIADYSQIELRVLAHMSNDKEMKNILKIKDSDIHSETASRVFNVSIEEVSYEMRRKAKEINFGLIYGMESFGLSKSLSISRKEASDLIDSYFTQFPKVKSYLDEIVERAKKEGYTETIYGRRRYIPELRSSNNQIYAVGKRMAMNAPIQGTAADIVKIAMINLNKELSKKYKLASIVLQIHDEIVVECMSKDSSEIQDTVVKAMENVEGLSIPLYVSSYISNNLANKNI